MKTETNLVACCEIGCNFFAFVGMRRSLFKAASSRNQRCFWRAVRLGLKRP